MLTDRRRFLRLAGLGAISGAAAACGAAGGEQPAPTTGIGPAPQSTPAVPNGPVDWAALRARMAGGLLLQSDAGYDAVRRPFNSLYAARHPAAIARCTTASDVQACVAAARSSRILVAARGGGHSYAGYSTPDQGLVIDLGPMNRIDTQPDGTAVIGAGARLIDVYGALAARGRALPAGSCPSVGIAGLTLGGGQGVLGRLHGLTCDRVRAVDVVLADATAVTASDGELFWALRGGGGGNFGIVTAFTFETAPAPSVTVFSLRFPPGSAADVLGGWQDWIAGAPDQLWSNCIVSAGRPPTCRVGGCFVGGVPALDTRLDDLVRRAGARTTARAATAMSYLDAMLYFAGCSPGSSGSAGSSKGVGQCRGSPTSFTASSRMLEAPMRDIATVVAVIDGRNGLDMIFDSLGGAIGRIAPDATAYPHRGALATVQVYAGGTDRRPVSEVQSALAPLVGHGAYVNYVDPVQADWAQAYYGANLPRLQAAARRFDPDRVFFFPQGVVST